MRIFHDNAKDDHSYTKGRQPPQRLQPRFRQLSDNIPRHYFPLCTAAQKSMITRLGTAIPLYQGLVRNFGYKARTLIKTQIVSLSAFLFGGGCGIRTHVRLPSNGFQDRLVMTASITLRVWMCTLFFKVLLSFYHISIPLSRLCAYMYAGLCVRLSMMCYKIKKPHRYGYKP